MLRFVTRLLQFSHQHFITLFSSMPQIYFDFANLNLFTAPGTPADNWQIFGLNGNDSLTGGSLADTIYGGDDNDSLYGLGGDDVLNGGTGDDFFDGGSGNDYAFGDIGNDTLFGGSGNDFFDGGAGADVANYSSFASSITLRPTGTILKGSGGTDQLFQVETIIANAGVSNNTIDASTAASPASINVNLGALTNNLQVVGGPVLTFTVTNFDNVIGTNQNDSITGDNQANQLSGNGGSDTINGGIGNDTLNGGLGNDTLNGGSNDDFLSGVNSASVSPGTNEIDTLTGASGVDRFILGDSSKAYYLTSSPALFGVNDYADYARITDFQAGVDKLQLRSGINYLFSPVSPPAIPGNFFVYRDNATVGSLTSADDLVAAMTVIGTFNSAIDVIFVAPIFTPIPITPIPITPIPIA
jgi:Ca2+-binding RTX toxin-like protein